MSWLDRALGWMSPEVELRRARARAALRVVRAYEGANVTRRTANWKTSGASANSEISGAHVRLRNRARDLVRNNPYGRRAISALVGNAIGTGITLGSDKATGPLWKQWAREADFFADHDIYGLMALIARAGFESGDCLVVRVRVPLSQAGSSGVPLKLKILEGDFLDLLKYGPQANGNVAIAGVEIDPDGRRVAFWIHPRHPGDAGLYGLRLSSIRVPAEDVIYHFEKERPGQVLGVPRLASGIMRLRDLDEYQDAIIVKKKIEACFAAFVQTDADSTTVGTEAVTETDDAGNVKRTEKLQPGQIYYTKPGETVEFGQPSSGPEAGFVADELRAIAVGAGCTYEQLTGDLSRVNYSSMRGGRAEFKILIEQYRWLTFIPQVCERIYSWFEEAAFLAGKVRTRGYDHVWTPPRWEYVNPKEDVETTLLQLRGGIESHSAVIRERGEDFDEKIVEIAEGQKALKAAGIEYDYSTGKTADPGSTAADQTVADNDGGGGSSSSKKD